MPGILKFIVLGVPILGLIVFVHELGHFIAARIVGVRVTVFSIGFGRRLFGLTRGDTDYRVSLLPLGGYVKMAGDNIEEDRKGTPEEFLSRAWYERMFIAIAGPAANFVMAVACGFLLFATGVEYPLLPNVIGPVETGSVADSLGFSRGDSVLSVNGLPITDWNAMATGLEDARDGGREARLAVENDGSRRELTVPVGDIERLATELVPLLPPLVGQVTVGTPAYQAGLRDGDRIVRINDTPISSWQDLRREILASPGREVTLVFERQGERFETPITPADQGGEGVIGIAQMTFGTGVMHFGFGESVVRGFEYTLDRCALFLYGLKLMGKQLFSSPGSLGSNLAGPIAIVQMSAQQAEQGRTEFLNWLIFVSVALMIMNLLPIPVLDGGHVLVAVIEGVSRRPLQPKVLIAMWRAGMVFLLLLMTFAIANDGFKWVQRNRAEPQPVSNVEENPAAPVEASSDVSSPAGDDSR